jgi:hypothetical protein
MSRSLLVLQSLAVLAVVNSCMATPTVIKVGEAVLEKKSMENVNPDGRRTGGKHDVICATYPPVPLEMRVGESELISVQANLESGPACRICSVRFHTRNSKVARWFAPQDPCSERPCAVLRGLSEGEAELVIEVCPGEYVKCQTKTFTTRVVR